MGQCVSSGNRFRTRYSKFEANRRYVCRELHDDEYYYEIWGQSESKRTKKKNAPVNKTTKGIATSFGFRRRPASTSRADNGRKSIQPQIDSNGNRGSTDDLCTSGYEQTISGRSTPLARPRKELAGQPLRTNRFGFRQGSANKTAKVGDVSCTIEPGFNDTLNAFNNNPIGGESTKLKSSVCNVTSSTRVPPKSIKQTVIVTYAPKQYTVRNERPEPIYPRSQSASRAYPTNRDNGRSGRFTFQSNHISKPQMPTVRNYETKNTKQVVNNTRKISGSSEGSSREGSVIDSGVSSNGSPLCRRRPRSLQMVMKNAHQFHLRELHVPDLDVMDDAVVTQHTVIPLPKFPTNFEEYATENKDSYRPITATIPDSTSVKDETVNDASRLSTLERYRISRNRNRVVSNDCDIKHEAKIERDILQKERLDKQHSFIKSSNKDSETAGGNIDSKDSSPDSTQTWTHAGEEMANRSQDDASFSLSISSCDDGKFRKEQHGTVQQQKNNSYNSPPHPLLMKASNFERSFNTMIGSTSSAFTSSTKSISSQNDMNTMTITLEDANFNMEALENSTQSLIDDETSPIDSLISTSSDSNNDLVNIVNDNIDNDVCVTSSAYITADDSAKIMNGDPDDGNVDSEHIISDGDKDAVTPGTPTNVSGSLSLSDGKDYFDDEIADQPGLTLKHGRSPSKKSTNHHEHKHLTSSHDKINISPSHGNIKLNGRMPTSNDLVERTASLDTLSSLGSDDLMMDDNMGRSLTSLQSIQDYVERLDCSIRSGLDSLDENNLKKELSSSKGVVKKWNKLYEQNKQLDRELAAVSRHSLSTSNGSIASIGASLPVRTARLLSRSRVHTPLSDVTGAADVDGSCVDVDDNVQSTTPANLLQDVVDIKILLLQLKRVLYEPGEEHNSLRCEPLDPLCNDGQLLLRLAEPTDHTSELKRQIIYLQSQVEERDRLVRVLQDQMSRLTSDGSNSGESSKSRDSALYEDMCNAATQTDRARPQFSSNVANIENTGLVSGSEQNCLKAAADNEIRMKRENTPCPITIKCLCGARSRLNTPQTKGTSRDIDNDRLKATSRIGSRYLQAISNKDNQTIRHNRRDSSVNERLGRNKITYSARSKSIENFQNHNLSYSTDEDFIDINTSQELLKHTSYVDLCNSNNSVGKINGKHINCNSKSTDTDCSSDGGYKSLPTSVAANLNSKRSSIPRRAFDTKLACSRSNYKASAV